MADFLLTLNLKMKYDLSNDETYQLMIAVLKSNPREHLPGVQCWQKKVIMDRYALHVVEGVETVVGKNSNKRVLKQRSSGHPAPLSRWP